MAQQPEPHWIVTNREDGQNVNNWHWVEKDCMLWLKKHMKDALSGMKITDLIYIEKGESSVEVTGEATANNRRGKTIFLFELEVVVRWELRKAADSTETTSTGTITFPYIGEDNENDDWEYKIKCTNDASTKKIKAEALPLFRKAVFNCLVAMKDAFTMKKPVQTTSSPSNSTNSTPPSSTSTSPAPQLPEPKPPKEYRTISGAQIEMNEKFSNISPDALYDLFLDSQRMSAITGGASIDHKPSGEFSLFNGAVTGCFVELVKGIKIVEKWRFSSWIKDQFSLVTIEFSQKGADTNVHLMQVGVPKEDIERTEQGWKENIWERIRIQFGFGSPSF